MSFGLTYKTVKQLKDLFRKYPEIRQVKIYGSRARGDYRKGSDIDLAFFSESKEDISLRLSWKLKELPTLYLFDVVNYKILTNSSLKKEIDKYGKVLYKRNLQFVSPSVSVISSKGLSSRKHEAGIRKTSFLQDCKSEHKLGLPTLKNQNNSFEKQFSNIWPLVKLEDIADVQSGNSAPQDSSLFKNGKYPFCRTSDVGKIHLSDNLTEINDYLNDEGIKGLKLFKKNTILFPKSGASTFLNHRVMLGIDSYVSNHLATICAKKEKAISKFVFNFLCSVDAKKLTNTQDYPSLKLSEIRNIQIPLPPLEEQKKIAGVLSQIQKAIETQDRLIEKTKELKQSTMKHLFTYGTKHQTVKQSATSTDSIVTRDPVIPTQSVTPTGHTITIDNIIPIQSFVPTESVIPAKAGIRKISLSQKNGSGNKTESLRPHRKNNVNKPQTKQTEVGEIPQDWKICNIENLFDLKQGKSLSSKKQTGLYLKPFLRTANVFWGYLDLKKVDKMDIFDKEKTFLLLKKGDLLVCEGGEIGRTAIWNEELEECYYQNHIHRLRAVSNKNVCPRFYMYWMNIAVRLLNIYGSFGNRTTIPNLPGKRLLLFKIPLPPIEEQKEIADILQTVDQNIEKHKNKKTILEELFKSILSKLMTRQVRVHKIDVNTKIRSIDSKDS